MPINAEQYQEALPALLPILQRITDANGQIDFNTLKTDFDHAHPTLAPIFEDALLTAILKAGDVPKVEPHEVISRFATLHTLFTYGRFMQRNQSLTKAFTKNAQVTQLEHRKVALSCLFELAQTTTKPGSLRKIYIDVILRRYMQDLFNDNLTSIRPLEEYLAELHARFPSDRYFDNPSALYMLKHHVSQALVDHFYHLSDADILASNNVGEFPYNVLFRKIKMCLRNEGWWKDEGWEKTGHLVNLSPYENPPAPELYTAGFLMNAIRRLDTLENPQGPHMECALEDMGDANVARTWGHQPYQQDCFFSKNLNNNIADAEKIEAESPVKKLEILTDADRSILVWNLMLNLQKKFGSQDNASYKVRLKKSTQERFSGSTANIALAAGNKLYFANVGDSESFVIVRKKDGRIFVKRPHPLDGVANNQRLTGPNPKRSGGLGMCRSIGDCDKETTGLLHHPHINSVECALEEGDESFILHASDGLRDAFAEGFDLENHIGDLLSKAWDATAKSPNRNQALAKTILMSAINAIKTAPKKGKMDNTVVMLQSVTPGIHSLSAVFDGHGGVFKDIDISGPRHVARRLEKGIEETFHETLHEAYLEKLKNRDVPITIEKTTVGNFTLQVPELKANQQPPPKNKVLHTNAEALALQKTVGDFPNYGLHLSSAHPILNDGCVSWDLTPKCTAGNNGFGLQNESDAQYEQRLKCINQQLNAVCLDKNPATLLLQSAASKQPLTLPPQYTLLQGPANLVSIYDTKKYNLNADASQKAQQTYLTNLQDDENAAADCHILVLDNVLTKKRLLLVNAHFKKQANIQRRLTILNDLKTEYACDEIKIAGNFQCLLKDAAVTKALNDLHWQQNQAPLTAVAFDFVNNKPLPAHTESGYIQNSACSDIEILSSYNSTQMPKPMDSVGLDSKPIDCLSSPQKIELLQKVWQHIQADSVKQNKPAEFSKLQQSEYEREQALCGRINNEAIYQTNSGLTRIDSVNTMTAYAGLRMHLAGQLLVETRSESGELVAELLEPTKNAQGRFCYPPKHPSAGQLITIRISDCNNKNSETILIDTANRMGLTVAGTPTPIKKPEMNPALEDEITPGGPAMSPVAG